MPGLRHGLLAVQPDATLCRLAVRGNPSAYAALHERYWPKIYAFVSHMLAGRGPREDCEEVAQDAFAQAFRALPAHDRSVPFKPWLYKIARNRSIDFLRIKRRPPVDDVTAVELESPLTTEGEAERRADLAWVVAAVHELPERQRAALVLRELGGLSYKEIAAALDATVPSVRLLLSRARAQLADAGQEHDVGSCRLHRKVAAALPLAPLASSWPALAAQLGLAGGAAAGGGAASAVKLGAILAATGALAGGAFGIDQGLEAVHHGGSQEAAASGGSGPNGSSGPATAGQSGDDRGQGQSGQSRGERHGDRHGQRGPRDGSGDESPEPDGQRDRGGDFRGGGPGPGGDEHSGDDHHGGGGPGPGGDDGPGGEPGEDAGGHSGPGSGGSGKGGDGDADRQAGSSGSDDGEGH